MSKQKNIILLCLLLLQAALILFVYRPGKDSSVPEVNLFEIKPADVASFTITDDEGKSIVLKKENGKWLVGEAQYPGDDENINNILSKIAGVKSSRLVTRTKASHARLKVADKMFNRKIEVSGTGQEAVFYIGTAPNSKSVHLRKEGANEVHQVSDLASWEVQAEKDSWWQSKYVRQNEAELTGLELNNANGSISFIKDKDGKWTVSGVDPVSQTDEKKVEEFITSVVGLSIADYMEKSFAPAGDPVASIVYKGKGGEYTLQIWPEDGENGDNIAKNSKSDFYAKIKSYILKDTLEHKVDDFLTTKVDEPAKTEIGEK